MIYLTKGALALAINNTTNTVNMPVTDYDDSGIDVQSMSSDYARQLQQLRANLLTYDRQAFEKFAKDGIDAVDAEKAAMQVRAGNINRRKQAQMLLLASVTSGRGMSSSTLGLLVGLGISSMLNGGLGQKVGKDGLTKKERAAKRSAEKYEKLEKSMMKRGGYAQGLGLRPDESLRLKLMRADRDRKFARAGLHVPLTAEELGVAYAGIMQRSLDDITVRGRSQLRVRADANAQISMLYDLAQANGIRSDMVDTAAQRIMHQFDYNEMPVRSGICDFRTSGKMFKTFRLFMDGSTFENAYKSALDKDIGASYGQTRNGQPQSAQDVDVENSEDDYTVSHVVGRIGSGTEQRENADVSDVDEDGNVVDAEYDDEQLEELLENVDEDTQQVVGTSVRANGVANAVLSLFASDDDLFGNLTYGDMSKVTTALTSAVDATVADEDLSESASKVRECILSRFGSIDGTVPTLESLDANDLIAVRTAVASVESTVESNLLSRTMAHVDPSRDTKMNYQPYPMLGMQVISEEMADIFISETADLSDEEKCKYDAMYVDILRDVLTGDSDAEKRHWSAMNAPEDASDLELRLRECGDVFRGHFDRMRTASGRNGFRNDYAYEWGCARAFVSNAINVAFPVHDDVSQVRLTRALGDDEVIPRVVDVRYHEVPAEPFGDEFKNLCRQGKRFLEFVDTEKLPSMEFNSTLHDSIDAEVKEDYVRDFMRGKTSVSFVSRHTRDFFEKSVVAVAENDRVVNAEEKHVDVSVPGVEDLHSSDKNDDKSFDK